MFITLVPLRPLIYHLIFASAALALVILAAPVAAEEETIIYVTHHADRPANPPNSCPTVKTPGSPADDCLTRQGMFRAEELGDHLRDAKIEAIFSTDHRRSWQTAMPTATRWNLDITPYKIERVLDEASAKEFGSDLITKFKGKEILVVGHDHTVQNTIRGLGGIGDFSPHFGALYVVKIRNGQTKVEERYIRALVELGPFPGPESIFDEAPDNKKLRKNISAAAGTENQKYLLLGSDELAHIQVLDKQADGRYALGKVIALDNDNEFDIEAITRHGDNTFFVLGSHSWRRKNISRKKHAKMKYADVKARFEDKSPQEQSERDYLALIEIDPDTGDLKSQGEPLDLRVIMQGNPVLQSFTQSHIKPGLTRVRNVPSKENGIDIEGLASDGEQLYLGFRGPVLRHGFTPVLKVLLERGDDGKLQPGKTELIYVSLDGRGIRDIARVSDGFLIIAGAVGDAPLPFKLYHWDGNDCLPGQREEGAPERGKVVSLGIVPTLPRHKAEALWVVKENTAPKSYGMVIGYDGPKGGNLTRFRARMTHR